MESLKSCCLTHLENTNKYTELNTFTSCLICNELGSRIYRCLQCDEVYYGCNNCELDFVKMGINTDLYKDIQSIHEKLDFIMRCVD